MIIVIHKTGKVLFLLVYAIAEPWQASINTILKPLQCIT